MMADVAVPAGIGRVRAWVWVSCGNGGCASFGLQRQVYLRRVALGVVELPHRLLCEGCGFDLGFNVWETEVPKIHAGREPTYREDIGAVPTAVESEPAAVADAAPAETPQAAETPAAKKTTPRRTTRPKAGDGS